MSTIVTYNRGAQGAPLSQSSLGDFSGAASFSTDFLVSPGWTATDFGQVVGAGGVYGNTDASDASSFIGPAFCYANADNSEFSFAIRAKLSVRTNGDVASFGLASAVSGVLDAETENISFKVTQAAAVDAITISIDDGTTNFAVALDANPVGYDSTEYHVYGAHVAFDGTKTTVRWFIDGDEVYKKTSTGKFAPQEAMGLAGYQPAGETSLLYLDWAGAACSERA